MGIPSEICRQVGIGLGCAELARRLLAKETAIMARLIKIYDADWANRKRRAARLDQMVWQVATPEAASHNPPRWPVWLVAAALAETTRAGATSERRPAVRCRAEEE